MRADGALNTVCGAARGMSNAMPRHMDPSGNLVSYPVAPDHYYEVVPA